MGNFHLEVYSGDEYLGAVRVAGRYAQMLVGSETYPFKSIEDACVALLALQNQASVINARKEKKAPPPQDSGSTPQAEEGL